MKLYSQQDSRWKNEKLGTCNTTIGKEGCLVTCYAMLTSKTPSEINKLFTKNKVNNNGCEVVRSRADKLLKLTRTDKGYPQIASVKLVVNKKEVTHFIVVIDGKTQIDPLTGKQGKISYKIINRYPYNLTKPMMKSLSNQLKKILQRMGKYNTKNYNTILKWTQKHFIDWQSRKMPDFDKQLKNLKQKVSDLKTENEGLKNNKTIKLSEESIGEIAKAIVEKIRAVFWKEEDKE